MHPTALPAATAAPGNLVGRNTLSSPLFPPASLPERSPLGYPSPPSMKAHVACYHHGDGDWRPPPGRSSHSGEPINIATDIFFIFYLSISLIVHPIATLFCPPRFPLSRWRRRWLIVRFRSRSARTALLRQHRYGDATRRVPCFAMLVAFSSSCTVGLDQYLSRRTLSRAVTESRLRCDQTSRPRRG